jgi:hypothetical protein
MHIINGEILTLNIITKLIEYKCLSHVENAKRKADVKNAGPA